MSIDNKNILWTQSGEGSGQLSTVSSFTDGGGHTQVTFTGDQSGDCSVRATLAMHPAIYVETVLNIQDI